MQQEIVRTLKQIDTDIRDFTICLECATPGKSLDEQRHCERKLSNLKITMQAHRSQIRAWASRFGEKLPSKDKLGAARSRIELELRRCQDIEKGRKLVAASERVNKRLHLEKATATPTKESNPSDPLATEDVVESEVKIMSEQLCAEDKEEMDMAKEFVCQICFHVVGQTPQLSSCSHLFCGDCIATWMEVQPGNQSWARRASSGGAVPCPICKEPLQKDTDLHAVSSESDGNSTILWQMLCGVKVMCANHSSCNSRGTCNWIGDYGSYQEHIRCCANTPLAQFENNALNRADPSNLESDMTSSSDDVQLEKIALEAETTASEFSEQIDSESVSESEHANSEDVDECESASLTKHYHEFTPAGDQGSNSDSISDFGEPVVEGNPCDEDTSLTALSADLIQLRAEQHSQTQENAAESHAAESTSNAAAQETHAVPSALNADAIIFEPAKAQTTSKPKRSSKKHVAQDTHGCSSVHMQAAALQYQARQAQMVQMAQMAYLQRLRSAQMASYQAAYVHAHMNQIRLAQRYAR